MLLHSAISKLGSKAAKGRKAKAKARSGSDKHTTDAIFHKRSAIHFTKLASQYMSNGDCAEAFRNLIAASSRDGAYSAHLQSGAYHGAKRNEGRVFRLRYQTQARFLRQCVIRAR